MRWHGFGVLLVLLLAPAATQGQSALFASPHTATCFLDINGDGTRSLDDPVFLQRACADGTAAGDARLFAWEGFPGGTLIEGQHGDAGTSTAGVASAYAFHDSDGTGAYSPGDALFLALGPIPGPLRPGDLPLVGEDAFASLRGDDPRVGQPLAAAAVAVGGESYQERDGLVGFTTADTVFLDLDGSGTITIGDLRLAVTAPPRTSSSTSSPEEPTPSTSPASATTPPNVTPSPNPAPPPGANGTLPPASGPRGTPSVGVVLAVAVLLGALTRRSH